MAGFATTWPPEITSPGIGSSRVVPCQAERAAPSTSREAGPCPGPLCILPQMEHLYGFLRRRTAAVDSFWALVLLVLSWVTTTGRGLRPGQIIAAAGIMTILSLSIALRRRFPEGALLLATAAGGAQLIFDIRAILADIAFLVIAYTVAAVGAAWASRLVLVLAPVAGVLATLRWGKADWGDARVVALQSLLSTLVFVLSWGIGSAVRTRRAYWRQLEERAAHLERECETQERIAVSAERARIARELHDLVAHSMSVMIVQADGASCAIDSAPGQARQALDTIALTGRHALDEMHQVVGLFQGDAAGAGEKATPPVGLDELERAVQQSRSAGLPVDFQVEGSQRALSEEAGLTVYRLLQEALTNTRKHAGPAARATVRLTYIDPDIEILVEDDGRGKTHSFSEKRGKDGHGHGLLGMRERIALLGGQIEQGHRPGGGFRIWARLPLHPAGHQPPTSTTSHDRSGD